MCKCFSSPMQPIFVCLLTLFIAAPSFAQTQQTGANMVTNIKGKLKSFQPGVLTVTKDDGTDVMVQLPDELPAFVFSAEAKPAFISRGMLVRFSGMFDLAGNPQAPIEKVEIIQPIPTKQLRGSQQEDFTPGVHGDRHAKNKPPKPIANYKIVGVPMGIMGNGIMAVQAGKMLVRAQLAENVKFRIRFNNLSLAQPGDSVSVAGFYQPPDETNVKAERITITTQRVYGDPNSIDAKPERKSPRDRKEKAE
ncbi:hypothetical protein CA13_21420 [Planctomycetes bacterium CA13]|uniref:DUF5666 domain-containing protein n=1 Tax=Novipirellula herctigrandis TaxID=2527986 RepID=A0A5C5Z113_9BACT|nr:hypothetical protein CA13_21420 [Planctomycetes bacterium CA13]